MNYSFKLAIIKSGRRRIKIQIMYSSPVGKVSSKKLILFFDKYQDNRFVYMCVTMFNIPIDIKIGYHQRILEHFY